MKKQIVYLFIHPTNGGGAALACALRPSDADRDNLHLLADFEPAGLLEFGGSVWRDTYDSFIADGYTLSNWHVTQTQGRDFEWPAFHTYQFNII